MNVLTYQIRLLEPLLLRSPGSREENSGSGLSFISGSAVRGVLAGRYLKAREVADPAVDPSFRRLFLDGPVRYLHAYPIGRNRRRALPRPLSWRMTKEDMENPDAAIYDLAVASEYKKEYTELPKGEFCWIFQDEGEARVELASPQRFVTLHNGSTGRMIKKKEESTVFCYEALAAGQLFGGAILADSEEDLKVLEQLLAEREAFLGGSRQAGYGLIRFEKIELSPPCWKEYDDYGEGDGRVIVTLLSDAIVRNPAGQVCPDPFYLFEVKPEKAYLRVGMAGGFNHKWALPLPQVPVLQAGSVFVYRAGGIEERLLEKAIKEGVGERRVEGFGRVAVNWPAREKLRRRMNGRKDDPPPACELGAESRALAEMMAGRLLRSRLDGKLMQAVNQLDIDGPPPSNSQLSRLRLAVRLAWREKDIRRVIEHLDSLRKPAREQLEKARVQNKPLLDWLRDGISQDLIWEEHIRLETDEFPAVAGIRASDEPLKIEYTMRLLEGLLKKKIRKTREVTTDDGPLA